MFCCVSPENVGWVVALFDAVFFAPADGDFQDVG
jgi:hypothetical protein